MQGADYNKLERNEAKRDWPIDVFQNMVRRWAAKCETWTIKV